MRYIIGAKWSFFEKMHFFCKFFLKSLPVQKKCVSLHRQTKTRVWYSKIGIWCNGNTTDSGPVIPGSSPGIPTQNANEFLTVSVFFVSILWALLVILMLLNFSKWMFILKYSWKNLSYELNMPLPISTKKLPIPNIHEIAHIAKLIITHIIFLSLPKALYIGSVVDNFLSIILSEYILLGM